MSERLRFGPFEVDARAGELRRDGRVVPLQDLPFRLLVALLERPGDVVTRAELTTLLWGDGTFVDSAAGLNTAVAKLREALGDQPEPPVRKPAARVGRRSSRGRHHCGDHVPAPRKPPTDARGGCSVRQ